MCVVEIHQKDISIPNFPATKQWQQNQSERRLRLLFLWWLWKEPFKTFSWSFRTRCSSSTFMLFTIVILHRFWTRRRLAVCAASLGLCGQTRLFRRTSSNASRCSYSRHLSRIIESSFCNTSTRSILKHSNGSAADLIAGICCSSRRTFRFY